MRRAISIKTISAATRGFQSTANSFPMVEPATAPAATLTSTENDPFLVPRELGATSSDLCTIMTTREHSQNRASICRTPTNSYRRITVATEAGDLKKKYLTLLEAARSGDWHSEIKAEMDKCRALVTKWGEIETDIRQKGFGLQVSEAVTRQCEDMRKLTVTYTELEGQILGKA